MSIPHATRFFVLMETWLNVKPVKIAGSVSVSVSPSAFSVDVSGSAVFLTSSPLALAVSVFPASPVPSADVAVGSVFSSLSLLSPYSFISRNFSRHIFPSAAISFRSRDSTLLMSSRIGRMLLNPACPAALSLGPASPLNAKKLKFRAT